MKTKLSLFLYLIFGVTITFAANLEPELAKQTITEVLAEPEFQHTREEYRWEYIGDSSSKPELPKIDSSSFNFLNFIARLLELLLWILLGAGIIFLIIYVSRWLKLLPTPYNKSDSIAKPKPRLLNQELTDKLPINIPQTAWEFWQSGKTVAAISLLYRGALSVLITREGLNINNSATENECLRKVKSKQPPEISKYFSELTRTWQKMAYAGSLPSDIEAQQLCQEWQRYFGEK
jgi:hypothetical protein